MKIAFFSTMTALPWGGSEILWAETARTFIQNGHQVAVNFKYWEEPSKVLLDIEKKGASIHYRERPLTFRQQRIRNWKRRLRLKPEIDRDENWVNDTLPDLFVVTFGYHLDWHPVLDQIQKSDIPYVINLQVAFASALPDDSLWSKLREFYKGAIKRFFLCEDNRKIMERMLCMPMNPYQIIGNPTKVNPEQDPLPFPGKSPVSLACIGRIQFTSKAQNILVDVLTRSHWHNTDLHITFYGEDQGNIEQLKECIKINGLEDQFSFGGYQSNPVEIYRQHAGLILTSHFEGLPMVTIEAMRLGRIAITTSCGRNPELIDNNETGFLATDADPDSVDEVLQRAWNLRDQWESMGVEAHRRIRSRYALDPVGDFVSEIESVLK